MQNFLGALQPVMPNGTRNRPEETSIYTNLPRVTACGRCNDQDDAMQQLKRLYKRAHPDLAPYVDDDKTCFGGVFMFDCTPYELIEKAADEETANIIRSMYDDAEQLTPFIEQ